MTDADVIAVPADEQMLAPLPSRFAPLTRALRHPSLLAGAVIVAVVLLVVIVVPLFTALNPDAQDPLASFAPPSAEHLMGADSFGRDLLARVLYGGRVTIMASISVVILGGVVGSAVGLAAGYFGGALGFVIMRLVDLLLAFPGILLALAVSAILGPGLENGVIAISVILVPVYARLVEGATAEVRHLPYVDAAVTLGSGAWRIILRACAAERVAGNYRADHDVARHFYALDRGARLHRPRRAAAAAGMGRDPRRRAELHHRRLVDHRFSRGISLRVRGRRKPDRRWFAG